MINKSDFESIRCRRFEIYRNDPSKEFDYENYDIYDFEMYDGEKPKILKGLSINDVELLRYMLETIEKM